MAMTPDQVRAAMASVMARAKAEPLPPGMPVRPSDPNLAGASFKLDTSAATRKKIDDAIKSGKVPPRAMPQMPEGMGIPEPQGTRPRPDDFKAVGSPVRTDADKAKAAATLADFIKNGGPTKNVMPFIPGGEMPQGVVAGNGSNPATPGLLESIANGAGGGNYTIPVPGLANGGTPPAAPPAIPASPNFVNGIEDYWKLSNDARQQAVKDFTNWAPGQMPQNQIMNWTDWLGAATNPTQGTAPTSTKLSQEQFNLLSRDEQLKLLNPGHLFESGLNQDGAAGQYMWGGPQNGYDYVAHDYSGYGAGLKEYGKQTNHADKYGDKVAGQFSAGLLNSIGDVSKKGDERAQFIQNNLKAYMDNPGMFDNMGMGDVPRGTNTSDPISRIGAAYDQQQAFYKSQAEREAAIATNKAQKKAEREAEAASRTARQAPKPVLEEEPEMNAFASGTLSPRRGREMGRKVSRSREPMPPALPAPQSNGVIPRPNGMPIGGQVSPPSGPMPRPTPDNTSTWPTPNQYPPRPPVRPTIPTPDPYEVRLDPRPGLIYQQPVTRPGAPKMNAIPNGPPSLPPGGVVDGGWNSPRPVQPYNPNVPGGTQGQRPNGLPIPAPVPNDSWGPVTPASGGFWEGPANPQPSTPLPPMASLPPGGGMVSAPTGPMPTGGVTNNMNGYGNNGPITSPGESVYTPIYGRPEVQQPMSGSERARLALERMQQPPAIPGTGMSRPNPEGWGTGPGGTPWGGQPQVTKSTWGGPPPLPGGAGSGQGNFRSSRLRYR